MKDFKVANIKISVKISTINYQDIINKVEFQNHNKNLNFITFFLKFTYTFFKPNSKGEIHCNITKIRTFTEINCAINLLSSLFPSADLRNLKIDNITSSARCDKKQNLHDLFFKLSPQYDLKYNLQKFPAVFIKVPIDNVILTVFIFSSGKVICVGAKSEHQVKLVSIWVNEKINKN